MAENENLLRALAQFGLPESAPKSPGLGLGLSDLFRRVPVNSLYYKGKTVVLDGYRFTGCRFDNCVLKVSSTNFELIDCVIDPSTGVEYGGGLQKVIQLFTSRYAWAPETLPASFYPQTKPDGTQSIKDSGT